MQVVGGQPTFEDITLRLIEWEAPAALMVKEGCRRVENEDGRRPNGGRPE